MVAYLKVKRLGVELMFNKNVIKLRDNKKYIEKAINIMAILCAKQRYNYKNNVPAYFKISLN